MIQKVDRVSKCTWINEVLSGAHEGNEQVKEPIRLAFGQQLRGRRYVN
jgi:hypothetical protein